MNFKDYSINFYNKIAWYPNCINYYSIRSIKIDKSLWITQWKANGLQSHKEEIILFLTQNFIDIPLISETHFTDKNYFSTKIQITIHQSSWWHSTRRYDDKYKINNRALWIVKMRRRLHSGYVNTSEIIST